MDIKLSGTQIISPQFYVFLRICWPPVFKKKKKKLNFVSNWYFTSKSRHHVFPVRPPKSTWNVVLKVKYNCFILCWVSVSSKWGRRMIFSYSDKHWCRSGRESGFKTTHYIQLLLIPTSHLASLLLKFWKVLQKHISLSSFLGDWRSRAQKAR